MPHDQRVSIHTLPLHFGRILTGSEGGQSRPAEDIPRILNELASAHIDCSEFLSHRFTFADIEKSIGLMRCGDVTHAIVGIASHYNAE
jgi:Zn-dependent alcohol dehydrogenase